MLGGPSDSVSERGARPQCSDRRLTHELASVIDSSDWGQTWRGTPLWPQAAQLIVMISNANKLRTARSEQSINISTPEVEMSGAGTP